jgi:hypothetical protein
MSNVETYYNNINGLVDAEITKLENRNALLEEGTDFIGNSAEMMQNYHDMMDKTAQKANNLRTAAEAMRQILANGIASGDIIVGDQKWTTLTTQIMNMKNAADQAEITVAQLYKRMLEIPEKELTQALNNIERRFRGLTAVISNSIDTLGERLNMADINKMLYERFGDIGQFNVDTSKESYINAEIVNEENLKKEREIFDTYMSNLSEYEGELERLLGDVNSTQE